MVGFSYPLHKLDRLKFVDVVKVFKNFLKLEHFVAVGIVEVVETAQDSHVLVDNFHAVSSGFRSTQNAKLKKLDLEVLTYWDSHKISHDFCLSLADFVDVANRHCRKWDLSNRIICIFQRSYGGIFC
jgi:hypothetical protein